ncbi:hypothetical protein DS745_03340 [Anaerobacillus alkaliphilus]|uniref:DUF3953 domain-containing protein n=1 Tax=Anaerobacillus alkaliphilus TaxID=1548597 RepID=A0A4Q0VXF8_9BACI|nr:DUF6442 family protein [Anaerobacillus alkaliphilus]RXJ04433.1 hypothetical protein DS745_03340 [Anaerobacillus alkaliphilus]
MNRKDILKKAQQEKKDEREEHVKTKAFQIGWLSVTAVILFLIIFRTFNNEFVSDILMILAAQTAAVSFYQYFNMRDRKGYLFTGIMCTIAVFLSFAALLSQYGVY